MIDIIVNQTGHHAGIFIVLFDLFSFLYKSFSFLLLLFSSMIKLAIFTFSTKSSLGIERTWFFSLLLMYKRTVLFYTFSSCIISTYFSSLIFLHGIDYLFDYLSCL